MQPTKPQQAFIDAVLADQERLHILTGEAGAGKTFTCAALAARIREGALFASPTHQAATVLRGELKAKDAIASVATVASLLGNRPNFEEEPGGIRETNFVRTGDGSFNKLAPKRGGLLVVDECSMVGEQDMKQLISLARNRGLYLVVTGDPEQLSPVQMTGCWDFLDATMNAGLATRNHLTENMRAAGEPQLATYINKVRNDGKLPAMKLANVKLYKDERAFVETLAEYVVQADGDVAKFPVGLAYRNATVDELGAAVREQLGFDAKWHSVGEVLRVSQPFEVLDWQKEYRAAQARGMERQAAFEEASRRCREVRLQTGDLIKVTKLGEEKEISVPFATSKVTVRETTVVVALGELEGREFKVALPAIGAWAKGTSLSKFLNECYSVAAELNTAIKDHSPIVNAAAKLAEHIIEASKGKFSMDDIPSGRAWADGFYRPRGRFLSAASACALTVHKAQGSGRHAVFIDVADLKGGPSELLYVAVSRARAELHILL